jgi:ATP-dependent RNA helicase DeaD
MKTSLLSALCERGYLEPTAVQLAVLEPETVERDLLVSAQTGSGKTVGYALAMAPTLLGESETFEPTRNPIALVVAPTRELALQVHRELEWLYANTRARITSCVGGMDIRREQRALQDGVHIVVGTPGRLRDHVERGNFKTAELRAVVLDEADEMLDLGFREDLEAILDATPVERRTLLFSATLPREIINLAKRYQRNALRIAATAEGEQHGDIEYRAIVISPHETERAVVNILRYFESPGALVFCATREAVRRLHGNLLERGFASVALSGELSQSERTHALQALRDGHARVCVATDVAARGIDLPDLGLVIQADLPRDPQALQHRSGRTGRAGRKGICLLLVPHSRRRSTERLLDGANITAEWSPPPPADKIRLRDQERLLKEVAAADDPSEEDLAAARALLAERTPEELAAALVRLHRSRLPAPEELSDSPPPRVRESRDRDPRDRDNAPPRERSRPERAERGPRPERGTQLGDGQAVVFRMNVGRDKAADPRWMIPVICRRGSVTKNEIGEIRIMDSETQFEIAGHVADHFAARLRRPDSKDPEIRIARLGEPLDAPASIPAAAPVAERTERTEIKPDFKKADFKKGDFPKSDFKKPDHKKGGYDPLAKRDFKPADFNPNHKKAGKGDFAKSDFPKADQVKGDFAKGEFKPGADFKAGDFPKKSKKLTLSGYANASGGPGLKRRKKS